MLKLMHHPLSADSRRVRVVLNEKNIEYDLEETRYWERDEEFLSLNPAGTLPVLVTDKHKEICGAGPICEYLEEAFDSTKNLIGRPPLHRAEVRRLTDWFSCKFYREVTKNLVWEKFFKKLEGGAYPNSQALGAGRTNLNYHLQYIEFLTKNHRYLCGEELSLADITAATQLSTLDYYGDVPWEAFVEAKKWYKSIKSRPSFSYILNDRVAGIVASKNYSELDF